MGALLFADEYAPTIKESGYAMIRCLWLQPVSATSHCIARRGVIRVNGNPPGRVR